MLRTQQFIILLMSNYVKARRGNKDIFPVNFKNMLTN